MEYLSNKINVYTNSEPFEYKKRKEEKDRLAESTKIRLKHSDRLPIICEVLPSSRHALKLESSKYLVQKNITVSQFMHVLRRKIQLGAEQAIFILTEQGTLPTISHSMLDVYNNYKNPDGFLYLSVAVENTFGAQDTYVRR